jgi:hypothetical protein
MKLRSTISLVLHATRLLLSLLALWLSFGWGVRKARKAFEKELVKMEWRKKTRKNSALGIQNLKMTSCKP